MCSALTEARLSDDDDDDDDECNLCSLTEPSRSWTGTSWRTTLCVSPTSLMRPLTWKEASAGLIMAGALATGPAGVPVVGHQALECPPKPLMRTFLSDCWYPPSTLEPSSARRALPSATSPSRRRASGWSFLFFLVLKHTGHTPFYKNKSAKSPTRLKHKVICKQKYKTWRSRFTVSQWYTKTVTWLKTFYF